MKGCSKNQGKVVFRMSRDDYSQLREALLIITEPERKHFLMKILFMIF